MFPEECFIYEEREKFDTPDLDSNIHENMVNVFNEMLEYRDIRYKVVFCDGGEKMKLEKLDPIKPL